ncbi:hypothetical protein GCM10027615_03090 [Plantactinospora veratri]
MRFTARAATVRRAAAGRLPEREPSALRPVPEARVAPVARVAPGERA